jgi:hypothetical protein
MVLLDYLGNRNVGLLGYKIVILFMVHFNAEYVSFGKKNKKKDVRFGVNVESMV